ncbi:thioesterase [Galbibacter sp. EGI 63066]|uniref:acyl-CoA thioesterase n=1 Tax=Galbibacter sp. EGI 63066 TaxID=2993559 RepID=UPI002248A159|nr:acyl-ACP thioesterase domain-containing protein [Galbibacter sp. EGI 63066]MCX2681481.1 thioesterase [Galbibacter sp. EGI 63066]
MNVFEKTIKVVEDDLDDLQHVNNVRYVQWIQDIAKEHWQTRASTEMLDNYIWMILTHYIEYKGQAFLDDELLLKTYIDKSEGVKSIRKVEVYNLKNQKLILSSTTEWCLLSKESKRPIRLTQELMDLFN